MIYVDIRKANVLEMRCVRSLVGLSRLELGTDRCVEELK